MTGESRKKYRRAVPLKTEVLKEQGKGIIASNRTGTKP
jgi:hypothetical protein